MAMAGLYRRILPCPPAIEFYSFEGKQLFTEALQGGTMEGFFKLISYFQTQSEPAFCGLATLSVVLNALAIDPGRKWKGPWRWFDESMLDCCEPLEKIKAQGITFGKVVCLAHCAGAKVQAFRPNQSSLEDFRKHVISCTSSEDCHLITSYTRKAFKQTGTGHFSPVGGYHAGRDMVLILDVARFKYPPHWVPLPLLWEAMMAIDETTGHSRGFMLVSRLPKAPSLLYTLSCRNENWINTAKYLIDDVPVLLKSEGLSTVREVLSTIFASLPADAGDFVKWIAEVRRREEIGCNLSKEEKDRLASKSEVLRRVQETELCKHVSELLSSASPCCLGHGISDNGSLPDIAASVCCEGAGLLSGAASHKGFCCRSTCIKHLKANGDTPTTVVSSRVVSNGNEQGVDMLVPASPRRVDGNCCPNTCVTRHPESNDVLTILLLALPSSTWEGIRKEELLREVTDLVLTKNLPDILQEEVLHLRRQLHFLKKCNEDKNILDSTMADGGLKDVFSLVEDPQANVNKRVLMQMKSGRSSAKYSDDRLPNELW